MMNLAFVIIDIIPSNTLAFADPKGFKQQSIVFSMFGLLLVAGKNVYM